MNYLAHACLSFANKDVIVGNMISDFVKGKRKFSFPQAVQNGIMLHREIDTFTDQHPVTKKAKLIFKEPYGLYAGAFIDVVYDHFLANDKNQFQSPEHLSQFSSCIYTTLNAHELILPDQFKRMLPYMVKQDWLFNYRTLDGIYQSFGGLVHRAKYISDSKPACTLLLNNYDFLRQCYEEFFPSLKEFAHNKFNELPTY